MVPNEDLIPDKIVTDMKILSKVSRKTNWKEVLAHNLPERLKAAIEHAWTKGYGLSAIQIGIPLRFAWFNIHGEDVYLMNPQIVEAYGKLRHVVEGCLSVPSRYTALHRLQRVVYVSDGKRHTAKGLKAQIIQHEIDHMDGILNVSKGVKIDTKGKANV